MPRDPVEINQTSAANLAKWRIGEMLKELEGKSSFNLQVTLRKVALNAALAPGGGIDEIATVLYGMGLRLTVDKNNPQHKFWIDNHQVWPEVDE